MQSFNFAHEDMCMFNSAQVNKCRVLLQINIQLFQIKTLFMFFWTKLCLALYTILLCVMFNFGHSNRWQVFYNKYLSEFMTNSLPKHVIYILSMLWHPGNLLKGVRWLIPWVMCYFVLKGVFCQIRYKVHGLNYIYNK